MKLLKKVLCGILSATMLITSVAIPVMADEDIKVKLDGKTLSFDVPPQIINDRTMVPLRAIFEALGATVDWNQETKTVTSTKGDTTIKLTIDSNTMYVNNNAVTLDSPACVVNDRTLVPVRAISEAYKTKVDWNGDTRTVVISSNTVTATIPSETTNTAFSKVKDYIIKNGTQNVKTEDEEYYVFVDNGDLLLKQNLIIKLSYNVDTDTINMYLGQSSNAAYNEGIATLNIYIKENTEPKLEFYAGEMVRNSLSAFEIYGYFDKNTHKFVETETKNFGKTAKLGTTEHNLFNSYLKLFGMGYLLANTGAMLDELGVYIDLSNANTNANTNTMSTGGLPELTQNDISIKLKIPTNGGYNWYAEIEVQNNSNATITFPGMAGLNGSLVQTNPETGTSKEIDVKSGESKKLSYYTSRSKKDMYLDNNSIGYFVIKYNGTQYYVEYGINGITTFYKGNVNGPA